MDNVANLDSEQDNIKIIYVYNDKEVETKDEVMHLIGLKNGESKP
jgi:sulfatase maturation enzyme AslB (radical SAM superfamily)